MAFRKIEAGLVHAPVDEFIGKTGTIFYDNDLGDFRISDGVTPGGIALSFGGGGGGNYTLPTATTTVKGGVKIDGSTITIANQVISVGTVPYSSLSGAPTIPTNTNQLTNGAAYITSSALSGYATESYVTGRGYITSSALSGYATESYVTTRGYLTSVAWNDITSKPTFATVATSGSYADLTNKPTLFSGSYADLTNKPTLFSGSYADLTNKPTLFSGSYADLTNKPTIPTNTNELTNGAGYITSTALSGYATESYVTGRGYITTSALTGLATETYVTTRGYLTSVSWNDVQDKPNLAGTYSFGIAGDDSTIVEIASGNTVQFKGATNITVATSADGVVTITGPDLSSYALTTAIPTDISELTDTQGLLGQGGGGGGTTTITNNIENPYSFSVAGDDSTLREIANGESIKFTGAGGITITTDDEGKITITGTTGTVSSLVNGANTVSLGSDGVLTLPNGSTIGDGEAGSGVPITTARGTILLGNLAECAGGESHFHIMKAGQQAIDLFLGDDNNYVKLPSTGGVEISSSEIGAQHYWDFGTDGVLTLPTGGSIYGLNIIGGEGTNVQADQTTEQVYIRSYNTSSFATHEWTFGTDGSLTFPDSTVQTTAWTGSVAYADVTGTPTLFSGSYNDLTDKPSLAGTYTFSIAGDDSTLREIGNGESIKFIGAGGITTSSDAEGNITITGVDAPAAVISAIAPELDNGAIWYNSTDGRTYVKYNDLWVDANPPVVPQVSTYLDGLVVEGTTITTVSYVDTDIKIHDLTFKDTGVIQLPLGGDIVDSLGNSVLSTEVDLTGYATEAFVTNALSNSGIIVSATAPTGQPEGKLWYNSASLELYVRYNNVWVAASSSGGGTSDYNSLTNKPTNVSQFANDANYVSRDEVYAMILELGSTN